jgi:tRNA A-37 threonylcarbamoyl transferase component Bud32
MIPTPSDAVLTGMRHLFDLQAVREKLNTAGAGVEGGQIFYIHYKPSTSCIAAYRFTRTNALTRQSESVLFFGKCSTPDDFALDIRKAQAHRWVDVPVGPTTVPCKESATIFYAFPNDPDLKGLRLFLEPKKLTRFFQQYLPGYPVEQWRLSKRALSTEVVRYKPERRAVLRSSTRAVEREGHEREKLTLYWRVYRDSQVSEIFRRMELLEQAVPESSEMKVPTPLGFDSKLQILVMEAIEGAPLVELLQTKKALSAVERTGRALAHLHTIEDKLLSSMSPQDYLTQAFETSRMLAVLSPDLSEQVQRIHRNLKRTTPEDCQRPGFVHGDFYYGQVLVAHDSTGFVDFDRSHMGSRLTDLGNFLAHLRLLNIENRIHEPDRLACGFMDAYAEVSREKLSARELKWWTALSLFLLAVGPFRRLEPGWPQLVQAILAAVEDELC